MRKIHLPTTSKRVETGVTQFNNDWPGVFIRGDNALFMAWRLEALIPRLKEDCDLQPFEEYAIKEVIDLLYSCEVDHNQQA